MNRLLISAGVILVAGLVTISSISHHLFFLQLTWSIIGIFFIFILVKVDWRSIFTHEWVIWSIYILAIVLLLLARFTAPVIRNTRSWLVFGSLNVQPVELAKIALILVYARYFSRRHLSIAKWKTILSSFVLFIIPAGLTAIQPDLGSASVLFGIWFGFLLVSGLPLRRVLAASFIFLVLGVIGWQSLLKGYQRERILGVFHPGQNTLDTNYSVIQSKIAIGSAGLWGKGYGQGSQTQLGFLSQPANDFILSALIEEWGAVIGLIVIGAFLFLVFTIVKTGLHADQNFEKFICLGVAMVFGIHFLLNAGSAVGIFPVVGVTFPFLSYGGSSLLTDFFLLAIINAIAYRL